MTREIEPVAAIDLDGVRLVMPDARYHDSYLGAMREFQTAGEDHQIPAPIDHMEANFEGFVERLIHTNVNPDGTRVPQLPFWIVGGDMDHYAGRLNIRLRLNEGLRLFGGHIGYAVRPSMRRRGIGTRALALGLVEARKLGLGRVLVTCDEGNVGSRKIIEANGGVLEDVIDTSHHDLTRRYWIDLSS